ncbi:MAG: type II secretion system F family protein [Gemmatimonadaceae bacterium]|nr:type II secretion system F family protein [Gemmatimonadaceae bacterium]
MPDYWYKALTGAGVVEQGFITAPDESEVEERLRASGSFLMEARVKDKPKTLSKHTDGKVPRRELLAFMEYLASSVQVGMPLLTTLSDVEARLESKKLRKIIGEVKDAISEEGRSLSEALAQHPHAFPDLFVTTIQAGEASGRLDFVLMQLVEYLDWQETISGQIRQATMYPMIVLGAIGLLVLILVGYVFPKIIPVLASRTTTLPLPTRIVMAVSSFLRAEGIIALIVIVALIVVYKVLRKRPGLGTIVDGLQIRMPIVGDLIRNVNMARLVTYFGLFYRSGVEIILALTLVERLIANRVVATAVQNVRLQVESGETLASAFGRNPIFPPMVVRSVALGESTGQLDDSLGRAQAFYQREVPSAVRRMITALQPALILVMGSVVLLVALAMILPILSIYQSIGVRK